MPSAPFVAAYRLNFELAIPRRFRVHLSGDERYEWFVDGRRVARGPARAPLGWWHFESFDLELPAGKHSFAARVWSLGKLAPWAQQSFGHGFLLAPEAEDLWDTLATGRAAWQSKILSGYGFASSTAQITRDTGVGAMFEIDGARYDWNWLEPSDPSWEQPVRGESGNSGFTLYIRPEVPWMRPSLLPAPLDRPVFPPAAKARWGNVDAEAFRRLGTGEPLRIPPHQRVSVVFDWQDYVAAYSSIEISDGAGTVIRLGWCEAPADKHGEKIDRTTLNGGNSPAGDGLLERFEQPYSGLYDTFRADGGIRRVFEPLWWRCGRFVFLEIETAAKEAVLESLRFRETRYSFEQKANWQIADPSFERMLSLCQRTLELCAHETFMDCPYWEQLQYAGDTRLQALISYVLSGDDTLARQALRAFAASRHNRSGWPAANHPSYSHQSIPTFALAWTGLLYDFARWRGDREFVREIMPAARAAVELWVAQRGADGLVGNPPGWNFVDWSGDLSELRGPAHGVMHWILPGALREIAELEQWLGEPEFAARAGRLAQEIAAAAERFWSAPHGLYADDLEKTCFSEHTNAYALISGLLPDGHADIVSRALFDGSTPLTRTQIYATHFLFEAAVACGRMDVFWRRLAPWLDLAGQGFVTTPEYFGKTRSECHAWSAHPLFHLFASMAGVRPASFGFETVSFRPQPVGLKAAKLVMMHPRGQILVTWEEGEPARITLPEGVTLAPGS